MTPEGKSFEEVAFFSCLISTFYEDFVTAKKYQHKTDVFSAS